MEKVLESDWKTYTKLIHICRDRYLQGQNEKLANLLNEKNKSPTDKYWELKKQVDEDEKILDDCFGYYSRSKMWMSILMLVRYGMIKDEEINQFSEALRNDIFACRKIANNSA